MVGCNPDPPRRPAESTNDRTRRQSGALELPSGRLRIERFAVDRPPGDRILEDEEEPATVRIDDEVDRQISDSGPGSR
jgi:hypothetical protein